MSLAIYKERVIAGGRRRGKMEIFRSRRALRKRLELRPAVHHGDQRFAEMRRSRTAESPRMPPGASMRKAFQSVLDAACASPRVRIGHLMTTASMLSSFNINSTRAYELVIQRRG